MGCRTRLYVVVTTLTWRNAGIDIHKYLWTHIWMLWMDAVSETREKLCGRDRRGFDSGDQ